HHARGPGAATLQFQSMFTLTAREQANPIAKNNRDHRDRDIVDQTGSKKLTQYVTAVNVYPPGIGESIRQFSCRARIELLRVPCLRRTMGHHDEALAKVGPRLVFEDGFIRPPTDY